MNERIVFHLVLESESMTSMKVIKCLNALDFFKPMEMQGKKLTNGVTIDFDKETFYKELDNEVNNDENYTIRLRSGTNSISFSRGFYHSTIIWLFDLDLYLKNEKKILQVAENLFINSNGVTAFLCSANDDFWQNTTDIQVYKNYNKALDEARLKPSPIFKKKQVIDTEFNPGHSHIINDLWFGSCWKMWFGQQYFQYIPKEVLLNFREGEETVELEGGSVRVTLYEAIWEYDKSENREIQWKFRRLVGMDEVAIQLERQQKGLENPDPAIEINTENLQNGGVRGITYYYNENKEVVPKSKATESQSFEFDQKGEVVWSEIKRL